jgi:hypothetical protein
VPKTGRPNPIAPRNVESSGGRGGSHAVPFRVLI